HKAVQRLFQARLEGGAPTEDDLVQAFRAAWVSEGFLSREHEEERLRSGEETLRRFHREEAKDPLQPTQVEEEFAFYVDRNRVQGRYDLVIEKDGHDSVLDFKTGAGDDPKKAEQKAKESLQLKLCALAHLRTVGRLPAWVELRIAEAGPAAG